MPAIAAGAAVRRRLPVAWLVFWTFAAGFGVGCVGAPTVGSLYRTVDGPIAAVAYSGTFWCLFAAAALVVVAGFLLPGPERRT